jgi:hypothetical protein
MEKMTFCTKIKAAKSCQINSGYVSSPVYNACPATVPEEPATGNDVLILIAKDKEWEGLEKLPDGIKGARRGLKAILEERECTVEQISTVAGRECHRFRLAVKAEPGKQQFITCIVSIMNVAGPDAVKHLPTLIREFRPRFLTTYGFCGGKEAAKGHAAAISAYTLGTGEPITFANAEDLPTKYWRDHPEVVEEPAEHHIVLTTTREVKGEIAGMLTDARADFVDMEIGFLFPLA